MSSTALPRKAANRFGAAVRVVVLAAILGAAFWLGAKALRDAPPAETTGGGGPPSEMTGPPPASVFVGEIQFVEALEKKRVTGNLMAVARAEVAARESGAVAKILVDAGDIVKEEQVLAVLDRRRIDAEIAESQAAITAAEVLVTQREAESKRAASDFTMKTGLFKKRAVSQRELLDAEREKLVTEAQVKAAKDQLSVAQSRLALLKVRETDLNILSPFHGRVVERHIEPGEWLAAGAPVVSLVSAGEIEAWLEVPERYSAAVSSDPSALKVFAEGGDLTATAKAVKRIAEVDMRSRVFQVVATLDDFGGRLVHGMSVSADLPIGKEEKLPAVPVNAVIASRLGEFIYLAAKGQGPMPSASKVPVIVRFRRDGMAFLENAPELTAGAQVVLEGNERLMPGQPLAISSKPETAKPGNLDANKLP